MKVRVEKEVFQKAVSSVAQVVPGGNALWILNNMYIATTSSGLYLAGTDLKIGKTVVCSADIESPGAMVVDAKLLSQVVNKMPGNIISIETKNSMAIIKSDSTKFNLPTDAAVDEYPRIEPTEMTILMSVPANDLATLLQKVVYATGKEDTSRPFVAGVYMEFDGNVLSFTATDSNRLAHVEYNVEGYALEKGILIPKEAVSEICRVAQKAGQEAIDVGVGNSQLFIRTSDTMLITRLLEAQFPPYRRLLELDKNLYTDILINRNEFLNVAERAAILKAYDISAVSLSFENNAIQFVAKSKSNGVLSDSIAVECNKDLPSVAFQTKYLIDRLRSLNSEQVVLRVPTVSQAMPCAILPAVQELATDEYILMPIRLPSAEQSSQSAA
jgi:DNA polymerase-3 subunit beta